MTKFLKQNWKFLLLFLIVVMAAVLRFWNITKLQFFTHDQARDLLVVKRILVDKKLTLLGPQSSIGGIYCPPAYYYTLAVPLLIFGLNPVGADVYTAVIGVLTVLLVFIAANELFGKPSGLFAAALYATSPIIVEMSKRSWNPNTLPFFSLLTLVLGYKFWKSKKIKYLIFASFSFGYALSLHYSAFCLIPGFLYLWLNYFFQKKKIKPIFLSALILLFFFVPLFLFDFRHNFVLSRNVLGVLSGAGQGGNNFFSVVELGFSSVFEVISVSLSGKFLNAVSSLSVPYEFIGKLKNVILDYPVSIVAHKLLIIDYYWWGRLIFAGIVIISFVKICLNRKKENNLLFLWLWFISAIIISRVYNGKIYFFYYLFLFPISFLLFGYFLKWIFERSKVLVLIILVALVSINFIDEKKIINSFGENRTLSDMQAVSKIIGDDAENGTFNIAASYLDLNRWDHQAFDYRYFVEALYKKRPLDWYPENYSQSTTLYLISEGVISNPLLSNIMEVQNFAPKTVAEVWTTGKGIIIYKLQK